MKANITLSTEEDTFSIVITNDIPADQIKNIVEVGMAILELSAELASNSKEKSTIDSNKYLPEKSNSSIQSGANFRTGGPNDVVIHDDDEEEYSKYWKAHSSSNRVHNPVDYKSQHNNRQVVGPQTYSAAYSSHYGGSYSGGYSYSGYGSVDTSEFEVFKDKVGFMKLKIMFNDSSSERVISILSNKLKCSYQDAKQYFDAENLPILPVENAVDILKEFKAANCFAAYKIFETEQAAKDFNAWFKNYI